MYGQILMHLNHPCFYIYTYIYMCVCVCVLSYSLKMNKINWMTSELWQIACKNIILTLVHSVALLCDLFINAQTWITLRLSKKFLTSDFIKIHPLAAQLISADTMKIISAFYNYMWMCLQTDTNFPFHHNHTKSRCKLR